MRKGHGVWGVGTGFLGMLAAVFAAGTALADQPSAADKRAAQLESRIEQRFAEDADLSARGLDATVEVDKVTLTGTVKTTAESARAEELARVKGVQSVDNQLVVEMSEKEAKKKAQEAKLEEDQRRRRASSDPYRRDPLVGAMPFEVQGSRELRMRTTGMADPRYEKAAAKTDEVGKTPADVPAGGEKRSNDETAVGADK